jgi:hypothetical protein
MCAATCDRRVEDAALEGLASSTRRLPYKAIHTGSCVIFRWISSGRK